MIPLVQIGDVRICYGNRINLTSTHLRRYTSHQTQIDPAAKKRPYWNVRNKTFLYAFVEQSSEVRYIFFIATPTYFYMVVMTTGDLGILLSSTMLPFLHSST